MSKKQKIQRFNLDEGRIWEAIEGLSPFRTTYTLEEVCEKLNELSEENEQMRKELDNFKPVMFQDMRKGTVILYSKELEDE